MADNKKEETRIKCGCNCEFCLCVKKHYNGGGLKPEECKKDSKKAD